MKLFAELICHHPLTHARARAHTHRLETTYNHKTPQVVISTWPWQTGLAVTATLVPQAYQTATAVYCTTAAVL